jgi:hypothetical protein
LGRFAPISGILFVACYLVGALLINVPSGDAPASDITSFYNDAGARAQLIVSGYLLVLAGVLFLWFLASLRAHLVAGEGASEFLSSVAFGGGLLFAGLVTAGGAIEMSVAANVSFGNERFVSPEAARLLPDLAIPLVNIAAMFAAIAMVCATSLLIFQVGLFARWIGWFGLVIAFLLLLSPLLTPVWTFPLWVFVMSVALMRSGQDRDPTAGGNDAR